MLTAYAYVISGATLLCRKFLKPKRLRDPQILVRPYSIWSDQDKLLTHVQRNAVETEIMNITSVARFIPPWRHISRIYLFRIQDTWDICDRPSMVMSLAYCQLEANAGTCHWDLISGRIDIWLLHVQPYLICLLTLALTCACTLISDAAANLNTHPC